MELFREQMKVERVNNVKIKEKGSQDQEKEEVLLQRVLRLAGFQLLLLSEIHQMSNLDSKVKNKKVQNSFYRNLMRKYRRRMLIKENHNERKHCVLILQLIKLLKKGLMIVIALHLILLVQEVEELKLEKSKK